MLIYPVSIFLSKWDFNVHPLAKANVKMAFNNDIYETPDVYHQSK